MTTTNQVTMKHIIESSAREVREWLDSDEAILIDVREAEELAAASVDGAIHIPMSAFNPGRMPDDDGKKVVFLCAMGIRSMQVGQYLLDHDLLDEAYNLTGGLNAWVQEGLPVKT